jgi:hypothetical protein
MFRLSRFIFLTLGLLLLLSACNLPSDAPPTTDPNLIFTAAAQTVEAQLTQAAPPPTATFSMPPTLPPPTFAPTVVIPTATNTPVCDLAQYVKDVTVPDGTQFAPNTTFTKTWRLRNIGACTWSGYTLVFDTGDAMSGPASLPIGSVGPGQEVDISVELKSPATEGAYRGYWRIKNSSGVLIPVAGGYQGKSFFVDIKVQSPSTTITLNAVGGTESGTVYEAAAGLAPVHGTILAGDISANFLARGYISFDISSLAGKTITKARLDLSGCSKLNDPFSGSLTGIWVGEVQYALPLDQSDYDIPGTGIQMLNAIPGDKIDVKALVQTRVTEGKSRFQIRLHPAGPSDGDGLSDYMSCSPGIPTLTITYQP